MTIITFIGIVFIVGICGYVLIRSLIELYAAFHFGAIYIPSSEQKMKVMMEFAKIKPGEKVIDLGSGDGRLVIAAAAKKAHAVGVELHPRMVSVSRKKIQAHKLTKYAEIRTENMWKTDVSEYDVVFVYGIVYIMNRLEKKLHKELKKGTRVVSNNYQFPQWKPVKEKDNVRLYIVS